MLSKYINTIFFGFPVAGYQHVYNALGGNRRK